MTDRHLIEDLWHRGWAHATAAGVLSRYSEAEAEANGLKDAEHYVFNGPQSPSMHLLIGYSFELLLKVAMLSHGAREQDLRAVGHDLVAALNHAERRGFVSDTPQLRFAAQSLRDMHLHHRFRYGGADAVTMPGLTISMTILNALIRQIGEMVYGRPFGSMRLEVIEEGKETN